MALLALLAGCSTPPAVTIQTFRSPPRSWIELGGRPPPPGALKVERGHLNLEGPVAYHDEAALGDFAAIADVALVGGDPRGIAGIFVFEPGAPAPVCACLAVRPGGEWRAYRSANPLEPAGGRGWKPSGRAAPTGFWRLGLSARLGEVRFSVDGREVEAFTGPSAPGGTRRPGAWSGLRFGIFQGGVASRWKNFIAGSSDSAGAFRPEGHVYWGDRSDGEASLFEAREAAKALRARPSRMRIYAVAADLEEAYTAFLDSGDAGRAQAALDLAARTGAESMEAARSAGEEGLHERAFGALAALGSRREGGREGVGERKRKERGPAIPAAAGERLAALKGRLRPLRLDFSVECAAPKPVFDPQQFWGAARESYGALERAEEGELRIHVVVHRSSLEAESVETERKVPVLAGGGRLAALEAEAAGLEKRLPDDLLDAETRAGVIRGAASVSDPQSLASLRAFEIAGKRVELQAEDGKALEKGWKRLADLRARIQKERGSLPLEYRGIPGTLHTSSILVEVSYSLDLDGKRLVDASRQRTYLGIEQWTHPKDAATGTPASRYSEEPVKEAVRELKERVLARFRTAISRQSLLSKVQPGSRLELLVRLARATGEDEDRSNLQWCLKNDLGLGGSALERTTQSLLGK